TVQTKTNAGPRRFARCGGDRRWATVETKTNAGPRRFARCGGDRRWATVETKTNAGPRRFARCGGDVIARDEHQRSCCESGPMTSTLAAPELDRPTRSVLRRRRPDASRPGCGGQGGQLAEDVDGEVVERAQFAVPNPLSERDPEDG